MLLEFLRATFRDGCNRNTRGIRRNNRIRLADFINARHQILLDLQVLDDGFTDPIRFGDSAEIIFQVTELDERLPILCPSGWQDGL
jgi:hypothetical protein